MNEAILRQQDELIESGLLVPKKELRTPQLEGILKEILNYDQNIVEAALGEFGHRLYEFVQSIDLTHSDLVRFPGILDGLLHSDRDLSRRFCQLLKLTDYAYTEDLWDVIPCISKAALTKLPTPLRHFAPPRENQQFVRLLPTPEERSELRETKKSHEIDLRGFFRKGPEAWRSMPANFVMYTRYSTSHLQEVKKAEKKIVRYKELGCDQMCEQIEEAINGFKSLLEDAYFGFHRITMSNVAVILAKMHGFAHTNNPTDTRLYKDNKDYSAIAYPLHEVSEAPERAQKLIDHLEEFPEANHKAAFDHYVVVIPSYKDSEMESRIPVLLGERDGKCHFLCYWI